MSKSYVADTFRRWGHLNANLDPLGRIAPFKHQELEDALKDKDAKKWKEIYCNNIGAEFMHMPFTDRCEWVANKLEGKRDPVDQQFILRRLVETLAFEKFIHTKYIGNKRFSLEGIPVIIPLLDSILNQAIELGFEIAMIGMPHRGRLTIMNKIVGVAAENIFAGFEDVDPRSVLGGGDVKYHKGATGLYTNKAGKSIQVHLASNPSHLEAINPVVMGRVRARQQRIRDNGRCRVLCIILHGDAAFAGQGITSEALNFANLKGFKIGGTVHVIVNNLIGFTAEPKSLYSGRYSSDAAKRLDIPIFHVNADNPDDVYWLGKTAVDYRKTFQSDVLIDLISFRRFGHSEIDDPTITLPLLYEKIKDFPTASQRYVKRIGLPETELDKIESEVHADLTARQEKGRAMTKIPVLFTLPDYWDNYYGGQYDKSMEVETAIPKEHIELLGERLATLRKDFTPHPKIVKLIEERKAMSLGQKPVDWATAESWAFASLLWDKIPVRFTGQDCRRGTFNQRHAVFTDIKDGRGHVPLLHLHPKQGRFGIYDSMLSEAAALGFEYGYSRDYPETLVCWEAQFGDFANGAQIIFDQFITAAEDKWNILSGVVVLLPHGYEGQGPEHSSARIERYLQLAAEDNIQVCYPSNAVQYFHLLRRQVLRRLRKPLIVFTPKSMLRLPDAASPIESFVSGRFENLLSDVQNLPEAKRILICSGKIVHELRKERAKKSNIDTAIVTIEQLYPFPEEELSNLIHSYPQAEELVWVQEEPANMGPLFFVLPIIKRISEGRSVRTIKRSESASPSTGSPKAHDLEQQAILKLAFSRFD